MKQVTLNNPGLPTSRQLAVAVRTITDEWPNAMIECPATGDVYQTYWSVPFALLGELLVHRPGSETERVALMRGASGVVVTSEHEQMLDLVVTMVNGVRGGVY